MNNSWAGECLTGPNHHFNWRFRSEASNSPTAGTPSTVDRERAGSLRAGLFQFSPDTTAHRSIQVPRDWRTQTAGPIKFIREELTTKLNGGGGIGGGLIGSLSSLPAGCLRLPGLALDLMGVLPKGKGVGSGFCPVLCLLLARNKKTPCQGGVKTKQSRPTLQDMALLSLQGAEPSFPLRMSPFPSPGAESDPL